MKRIVFYIFMLSVFIACNEDDQDTAIKPFVGKKYVSLRVGQEVIYQIDSAIYNEFSGRVDSVHLQLREYIEGMELDAENRESYLVEIYTRSSDTLPWRFNRVTKRTLSNYRYEVLDNNVISVPLVFPISEGKKWNSNVLNAREEKEFEYKAVNEAFTNGSLQYDSTLRVLQFEEDNFIQQKLEREVFAVGVGLVFREHMDLETELTGKIRSGFESQMRLISFK